MSTATIEIMNVEGGKVELFYPNIYPQVGPRTRLTVSMDHTRAADQFAVEFDSDRNGWIVFMTPTQDVGGCMAPAGPEREVAFIPAWLEDEIK